MPNPFDDLKTAVQAAAGRAAQRRRPAGDRLSLERPKKAGFGDYSTNAAMLLAPALGEPPRAVAERLGAALQERLGGRVDKVEVAGPGFLNLFLADAWYLAAVDEVLAAGDDFGRGTRARAHPGRVRLRQPDRPADRGVRPPRRVRRRARADPRAGRQHRRARVLLQRRRRPGPAARRSRSSPARAARSRRRTATRASTSPSVAAQIPDAASKSADELARAGVDDPDGRHPRDARALPRALRPLVPRARRCTRATRARGTVRARSSRPKGSPTGARARCGCAPPRSPATRRTARSCAPPASRPTSRPTSPTTGTSSSAASTRSSTCSAPTITATSCG